VDDYQQPNYITNLKKKKKKKGKNRGKKKTLPRSKKK
jgi:hypothetical protein